MATTTERKRGVGSMEEGRRAAFAWGTVFTIGLLLFAGGVLCLIAAGITGLASIILFGAFLTGAGVVEIVHGFRRRGSGQFFLYLLAGLLSLVVGLLFLARPLAGLAAVTLLLAGYFFAVGIFRGVTSLMDRYPGWGWDLLSGAASVVLGIIAVVQWPISSLWLVGVLVGVELIARGATTMAIGLGVRRLQRLPA